MNMKLNLAKKENKYWLIVALIIIILICSFFIKNYVSNEVKQYKIYNDYTRGNQVMTLSFNKNLDVQYLNIRLVESTNSDKKISREDLIYDFSLYEIIPILNYLNDNNLNDSLISSFTQLTDFISNFNMATIGNRENIFITQPDGNYYVYQNNEYKYYVEKKVITKKAFNKMYNEYLSTINEMNVTTNFINKLLNYFEIKNNYSSKSLNNKIKNDYSKFYDSNNETIQNVIASDLANFVNYLNSTYLEIDNNGNIAPTLKLPIETENINLTFCFKKLDRIYVPSSKYYTFSYQLDIINVWNQLKNLNYPMLYI